MNEETKKKVMKNKKRKAKIRLRVLYTCCALIFLLITLVVVCFDLFSPPKTFSESENRMLTQRPELSLSTIADGRFMDKYESYVTDQFVARDFWVSIKTKVDKLCGKKESNGVLIGKKDYLFEKISTPDEKNLADNLAAINNFYGLHSDLKFYFALVPNAANILSEYLPANAPVRDQNGDMENVKQQLDGNIAWVDMFTPMSNHREEAIYYKTDHHWTSLGAFYGFEALSSAMDIDSVGTTYDRYAVSTDFTGTLASKSGYTHVKDTIEIFIPNNVENEFVLQYVEEQRKTASIYDSEALTTKDKYEVFLGGNFPMIDLQTTNKNTRRLLLFKDSYANSMIPFLTPYFREIVIIDPRYYYGDIETVITNKSITDVLFLYNGNTFFEDNSIADVLAVLENSVQSPQESEGETQPPETPSPETQPPETQSQEIKEPSE